jgi:thioredoxin reductase (NADPH)
MIETDALVIGAGPVGLFQVFELGLLGMRAQVVDSLPAAGGQCIALYADKPIYDIPGTPRCSARELIDRLLLQIAPFAAGFHFDQQVDVLRRETDGRFFVETSAGTRFLAKVVMIAGGVGSFQPRRLKIEGIAAFEGSQVFYGAPGPAAMHGQRVLVVGDGDAAIECALSLAGAGAASVTLMHRRDEFKAAPNTIAALREARADGRIDFIAAQGIGIEHHDDRLDALTVLAADGASRTLPLDTLIVLTGLSPKLGPIADWGLALERKQLVVDTAGFQTSMPGIFAVGDVNTYRGKKKLILCGFHEAALAAFAAAEIVFPDRPVQLEYTTTSPRLQCALGVMPKADERD